MLDIKPPRASSICVKTAIVYKSVQLVQQVCFSYCVGRFSEDGCLGGKIELLKWRSPGCS